MAASVSPPPATENAALLAIARAMTSVPAPNWSISKTPTGPFQIIVPAVCKMVAKLPSLENGTGTNPQSYRCTAPSTKDAYFNLDQVQQGNLQFAFAKTNEINAAYTEAQSETIKPFKEFSGGMERKNMRYSRDVKPVLEALVDEIAEVSPKAVLQRLERFSVPQACFRNPPPHPCYSEGNNRALPTSTKAALDWARPWNRSWLHHQKKSLGSMVVLGGHTSSPIRDQQ